MTRPVITISTNPRAGELGSSIAGLTLGKAVNEISDKIGQRMSAQLAKASGAPLTGGVSLALTSPVDIQVNDFEPLPGGTGNGLSAFYYALLLLLAGFTGSIVVSSLVDSMLGFVPAELGPMYRFAEPVKISRFRTLLVKWGLMVVVAALTSASYIGIATALGMPIPNAWTLWAYGAFTIAAVGITSTSLIAVLGSVGLLVNLFIFVMLGLPSNGATIPLEAAPRVFGWLAKFEPMHQVFLGARALLYFDGRADAGLTRSLTMSAIGLVIGLADRRCGNPHLRPSGPSPQPLRDRGHVNGRFGRKPGAAAGLHGRLVGMADLADPRFLDERTAHWAETKPDDEAFHLLRPNLDLVPNGTTACAGWQVR